MQTRVLFFCLIFFLPPCLQAQNPVASFSVSTSLCRQQQLLIENTSTNAQEYQWDFCPDDFLTIKALDNDHATLPALSGGHGYKLIYSNGEWFGFVTSTSNNKLYRLDFGSNPINVPIVTDLGNPGGKLVQPEGIDIFQYNGNWYGFIGSLSFSSATQGIIRLDFGSSLQNIPVAKNLGNFGFNTRFRDLKVVQQGANLILLLVSYNGNAIIRVNYRDSFDNTISAVDIFNTGAIANANLPVGLDIVQRNNSWIVLLASLNNSEIVQLNFNSDFLAAPTVEGHYTFTGMTRPYKVKIGREGGKYYAVVSNESVPITIIDFKDLYPANTPTKINHPALPVLFAIENVRIDGAEVMTGVPNSGIKLNLVVFEADCGVNNDYSTEQTPGDIYYNNSGNQNIELVAFNTSSGSKSIAFASVTVSNSTSPDIDFYSQNFCSQHDVKFTSQNLSGDVTNYSWDFGDNTGSSDANPTHVYTIAATYYSSLTVTASNGCQNFVQDTLQIVNPPQASFDLPQGSPNCTNQMYVYNNTSTYDNGSIPTWQWNVNGSDVSTDSNLTESFETLGSQTVKLAASIPGCSSEQIQTFVVSEEGLLVDFSIEGKCQKETVQFTNETVGSATAFAWDFGNTNTASAEDAQNIYDVIGTYQVTLVASNLAGCNNSMVKDLIIYSLPQPNFQLELPPFSCSSMPSQFNDLTPSPVDSNITSWDWNFGDTGSGTNISALKNPTHIYDNAGQYEVTLTAGTNYGCVDSLKKTVTITQTPDIEILNTPACDDVPVTFSASSSGDLQSWNWQIGVTQFFQPEPTYLFTNPGSYNVNLDAVGNNNCIASTSKNVIVPQSLVPDFVVEKNCVGQSSEFTDVTTVYDDPIATYAWSFGDAGSGSESSVNHVYQSTGNYNVNLNITTLSGCNYARTKSIAVGNPPQASFTASPDVGVPPLNVTFTNTSSGANQYLWNFNDENNTTSTEASPQFSFLEYGNYVVDLIAYNAQNCSHTVSKVVTAALPFIDVGLESLIVSENANGLLTGRVVIHNKGNITVQNLNLLINLSGIEIQQTVTESIPPYSSILFTLDFNIVGGNKLEYICVEADLAGDNSEEDNSVCTSFENEVVILAPYPNPTQGSLYVDWISPEDQLTQLFIYDPLGKLVSQNEVEASKGFNSALLNLESLTQGIYYLTFHSGQMKRTLRFAVSR